MGEDAVQAERSSAIIPHESQDLVVPSPSPTQSSPAHSLTQLGGSEGGGAAAAAMPSTPTTPGGSKDGQVNAITVLTLLDKLVNMLDTVQENQHKMEQRQAEMENAVRGIQSDITKLSKCHTSTSNSVSKLLEKSRKVSVNMKEVKDKMDKQAVQVKKLEANHAHLLKRNHFKVLIFQEENEIPASVFVKDPAPYPRDAEEEGPVSPPADANRSQEEALQTINLSSDEELGPDDDDDEVGACHDMTLERMEKSRAEKIKRSSLKKVDSLKKAFSRQNIEKKMNKLGTKIVSHEQREKIKKSLTPNHQKSPTAKSSSFKVSPLTFNVKKVRDGEGPAQPEAASTAAAVELAPICNPDEDMPFTEVHTELAPGLEEDKAVADSLEKEEEELPSPSSSGLEADLSITEDGNPEYALSATLPQEDHKPEEEEEAAEGEEAKEIPKEEVPLNEAS